MSEIYYYGMRYGMYLIYLIIVILIFKSLLSQILKRHHSNWNTLLNNFNFSTQEFYKLLKEELLNHNIRGLKSMTVSLKEGSFFSSSRTYLRVTWKDYQYDVCAAPFGKGFFVSWWLLYKNSLGAILLSKFPFVGKWLVNKWYPITYYKVDTASMFMTYAQSSVLKVIDDITKAKGIRVLNESERKPVLNNVFIR